MREFEQTISNGFSRRQRINGYALLVTLLCLLISLTGKSIQSETPLISITGHAQGTTYSIKYYDGQNRNLKAKVDSILNDFDKCLSLYREDSELSKFNQSISIGLRQPYFYPVLKKSLEIYRATNGAFDPTIMPLVEAYGFGPKGNLTAENVNVDSLLRLVGFNYIQFDSTSVKKIKPNVRLDFNGIAQGYSVDVIGAFLESQSITRFMVEIGGEILSKGSKNEGVAWVAGIENPLKPESLLVSIQLTDMAMTTAGNYRNHFKKNGRVFNHIINPKTGSMEPSSLLSVTVFAKDAITADGYDTAFFVMGLEKTKKFLAGRKDIDAYLIYTDRAGKLCTYVTEGIKDLIL